MNSLREASAAYYGNDKFSDFTITCGDRTWKVHRCFISAHSKYFERACSNSFLEAGAQKIDLKEDLPEAVDCMIQYFYKLDYEDCLPSMLEPDGSPKRSPPKFAERIPQFPMQLDAWVYATAEKYEALELKTLALDKFRQQATKSQNLRTNLMCTAYTLYKLLPLPENDRQLHQLLIDAWILKSDKPHDTDKLEKMAAVIPRFAAELNNKLLAGITGQVYLKCKHCEVWTVIGTDMTPRTIACRNCLQTVEANEGEAIVATQVSIKKFW